MKYNLLEEPIFSVSINGALQKASLADVFASFSKEEDLRLEALRPFQEHAWRAFTVQLGAACKLLRSWDSFPTEPAMWVGALVELAGSHEAFCLLVDDWSKPAFMQPSPGVKRTAKISSENPQQLDMLVASKNFDEKSNAMHEATPEHWALALINLQTKDGFLGRGNYGIARMNSGFGNRSAMCALGQSTGAMFCGEAASWTKQVSKSAETFGYDLDGQVCVWALPWDGAQTLTADVLHPLFVEVCRRVRLFEDETGKLRSWFSTSKAVRTAVGEAGITGDFWAPVDKTKNKLWSASSKGFSYDVVSQLLFDGGTQMPESVVTAPVEHGVQVGFSAMARGQGKTEGYHRRTVFFRDGQTSFLFDPVERKKLYEASATMIQTVSVAKKKILKPALLTFFQGGPEELDYRDEAANGALALLDHWANQNFFSVLFAHEEEAALHEDWESQLAQECRQIFHSQVRDRISQGRQLKGRARSESRLYAAIHKHLPRAKSVAAKKNNHETTEDNEINANQ